MSINVFPYAQQLSIIQSARQWLTAVSDWWCYQRSLPIFSACMASLGTKTSRWTSPSSPSWWIAINLPRSCCGVLRKSRYSSWKKASHSLRSILPATCCSSSPRWAECIPSHWKEWNCQEASDRKNWVVLAFSQWLITSKQARYSLKRYVWPWRLPSWFKKTNRPLWLYCNNWNI